MHAIYEKRYYPDYNVKGHYRHSHCVVWYSDGREVRLLTYENLDKAEDALRNPEEWDMAEKHLHRLIRNGEGE